MHRHILFVCLCGEECAWETYIFCKKISQTVFNDAGGARNSADWKINRSVISVLSLM